MKVVTVHTRRAALAKLHKELSERKPDASVLAHVTLRDLLDQIVSAPKDTVHFEIVAHGTPLDCGEIYSGTADEVGRVMRSLPKTCKIVLSGCNTGVWANPYPIAQRLANAAKRPVFGCRGYIEGYAFDGTMATFRSDPSGQQKEAYPYAVDARFPASMLEFQPMTNGGGAYPKARVHLDASSLKAALAVVVGDEAAISYAAEIDRAITRPSVAGERPTLAGHEAVYQSDGIEFELFANMTHVDHHGDVSRLGMSQDAHDALKAAIDYQRARAV